MMLTPPPFHPQQAFAAQQQSRSTALPMLQQPLLREKIFSLEHFFSSLNFLNMHICTTGKYTNTLGTQHSISPATVPARWPDLALSGQSTFGPAFLSGLLVLPVLPVATTLRLLVGLPGGGSLAVFAGGGSEEVDLDVSSSSISVGSSLGL